MPVAKKKKYKIVRILREIKGPDELRKCHVLVRLTKPEHKLLTAKVRRMGTNRSSFLRNLMIKNLGKELAET